MRDNKGNQFSSIIGFLMVIIGFAVGVGSLWRFPYIVGENGGAIFIIAYLLIILVIGVPLLTAEIAIGFNSQKTPIKAYKQYEKNKPWHLAAYLHIAAALFIVSYTIPVYAWILNYLFKTITGGFIEMNALQISEYFGTFTKDYKVIFSFAILNWFLLIMVVRGGLQSGVEKISKILLPLLAVIMIVVIVLGLQIPNSIKGVEFLLKPDLSKFTYKSLLAALGQAFFAIGIGMLVSMIFGSYVKDTKENILKSSVIVCIAIVCAGVAAGFMIFPMVFASGLEPTAGPGLTFIVLPTVFNQVKGGTIIGALFYIGFYIAAFTSALGVIEAVVGLFMDEMKISRNKALTYSMTIIFIIGSVSILSDSVFNFLDMITNNYIIVIGAFIISIFTGWVWGAKNFVSATNVTNPFMQAWLTISIKYICPIVIVVLFITSFFNF